MYLESLSLSNKFNQGIKASPPGWAPNTETVNQDRRNPKTTYNKNPKNITISVTPVFLYLLSFIKNSPKKGTNRKPIVKGVGTRKSIIIVFS